MTQDEIKIEMALDVALQYGQTDGAHHKAWVIDQMIRHLTGREYHRTVKMHNAGVDGPETYTWDTGTAP